MKQLSNLVLFICIFGWGIAVAQPTEIYSEVRIFVDQPSVFQDLANNDIYFDHIHREKTDRGMAIAGVLNSRELATLQTSGIDHEVLIPDMTAHFLAQPKLSAAEQSRIRANSSVQGFEFGSMGGYYTFAEVVSELDSMRLLYPNLISQKQSIGSTHQGRDVWMVKISDNPDIDENEPEVLYDALHHAREPQSMMTVIYYMYYLLENYGTDPEATYLVDNRELYFVPVINPDGYEYNRQTNPNGGGFWRKNRRNNGSSYGVDLNRNYGHMWGYDNSGSSPSPGSDTYRGPSAFSEPETQAIRDFCNSREFKMALNYHTYSDLLIYPWGYIASFETPDSAVFREYAADMTQFNNYTWGTGDQTVGYLTNGDSDDWMYGEQATKPKIYSMTPEVGGSGDGFWPSQSRIYPLAEENLYPNLFVAWAAGEFVKYSDYLLNDFGNGNGFPDPGENVDIRFTLKNLGLSDATGVSVALVSDDPYVQISAPSKNNAIDIPARGEALSDPLTFTIAGNAPQAHAISIQVQITFNDYTISQNLQGLLVGTPQVSFSDGAENGTGNWNTGQGWNTTTSQSHSASRSFTDSPSGNYGSNINNSLTLQVPLDFTDVTAAYLEFWTKWAIESRWDFAQVHASTNGTSWTSLSGLHTIPGSGDGVQTTGEPGYDGFQSSWVKEQMDLSQFSGAAQLFLRFRLRSDVSVEEDGWYVDDISISAYGSGSVTGVAVDDGWNLISLPLNVSNSNYLDVFPNALPGTLFGFDGSYVTATELTAGNGYWLRFAAAELAPVTGQPIDALQLSLSEGWNLIGGISCAVAEAAIDDPAAIVIPGTLYGFSGSYFPATGIEPGNAYWIRASANGTIGLTCGAAIGKSSTVAVVPENATVVTIADNAGHHQQLYLNVNMEDNTITENSFSLPPLPPSGMFDARFSGDVRAIADAEATIDLQARHFPLRITVQPETVGKPYELKIFAGTQLVDTQNVTDNRAVLIANPDITKLQLRVVGDQIPEAFTVAQNYPNPFNPVTEIRYALPNAADVQVVVYNALGQQIKTLVSTKQEAGNHTVVWDATDANGAPVSSGLYFYRVKAGAKIAVRKMLLMR